MKLRGTDLDFIVLGENIHCTRVLKRNGPRIKDDNFIQWVDGAGKEWLLPISDAEKRSQNWEEGRVKHFKIAMLAAKNETGATQEAGVEYIRWRMQQQVDNGADYLDLNVDEISFKEAEQQQAMEWLVRFMQEISPIPLCVDSSNGETIRRGLEAADDRAGKTMLNSASLERISSLDVAKAHDCPVVVTAAGQSGMPQNTEERVDHATQLVDAALAKGVKLSNMYVDPLMFPISVDSAFGNHVIEAIRQIRQRYGPEIHITGGFSNISFGLPARRLINDAFFLLAIEAGADSGLIDPVTSNPQHVFEVDRTTDAFKLAEALLRGEDKNCKAYLKAYRKGDLAGW
jgi:cobalamin-dependent methionine synthase I